MIYSRHIFLDIVAISQAEIEHRGVRCCILSARVWPQTNEAARKGSESQSLSSVDVNLVYADTIKACLQIRRFSESYLCACVLHP